MPSVGALVRGFPAWPDQQHTDVSCVLEVLEAELREDVTDPVRCLRAAAQWPFCSLRRIVHTTDGGWCRIAKEGVWRRIYGADEEKRGPPRC